MSNLIYSQRFGDDYFEIKRVTYETISASGGFNRRAGRTRDDYYLNGKRTARRIWFARKRAATITPEEAAEAAAREAKLQDTFTRILAGTF
jgi:hypothetical protein